jgi:hypothetical protein
VVIEEARERKPSTDRHVTLHFSSANSESETHLERTRPGAIPVLVTVIVVEITINIHEIDSGGTEPKSGEVTSSEPMKDN